MVADSIPKHLGGVTPYHIGDTGYNKGIGVGMCLEE